SDSGFGIGQWTYLPLHRTYGFEYRIIARATKPTTIKFGIAPAKNYQDVVFAEIPVDDEWRTFTGHIELPKRFNQNDLYLVSIISNKRANFVLDRVLLYPDDHIGGADPDVVRFLRDSKLPLLRWPGGNFVSGYHWQLGIGPIDARPTVPNPAWEGLEYNLFGTDEFISFCREVGCEPMICVNAGNGTPEEAGDWVEYCNGSIDTPMGRLRAENGHPEPYNVKYWEIGNEIYGRWQVTWTTPDGNLDRYKRFGEAMLKADPTIKLLACGFGNAPNSEWNYHLIDGLGKDLYCITDHILTGGAVNADTDPKDLYQAFMGYSVELEKRYDKLHKKMLSAGIPDPHLAITELQLFAHFYGEVKPDGKLDPNTMPRQDSISEAIYYTTIVNLCVRLGKFVELLTHSATVNHGGGLRKERECVYANPVHLAQKLGVAMANCVPVAITLNCETYSTHHTYGDIPPLNDVPVIDSIAGIAPNGDLMILLVHRGAECGTIDLTINIGEFKAKNKAKVVTLAGETWYDRNTLENPKKISLEESEIDVLNNNQINISLSPFTIKHITIFQM
ncbi:MAG: alpha-N-arabinofuranosidase, partial [Candidatus Poribacteria bacterium]